MPPQEKVWTSLSDGSLMFIFCSAWLPVRHHHSCPFWFGRATLVHDVLFDLQWADFYCIPSSSFGVGVLSFGIDAMLDFVYQILNVLFDLDLKTLSLSFFWKLFDHPYLFLRSAMSVLHQLNVLSIFIYRYQPGSTALSRLKGNRGRVWRCLCPQHQPWLLTTSVRLCQRTGIYSDTHIYNHRRFDWVLIRAHKLILCEFVYQNPSLHLVMNLVFLSSPVYLSAWLDHNVGSSQWEASKNYQWCPPSRDSYTACEGTDTHTHTHTHTLAKKVFHIYNHYQRNILSYLSVLVSLVHRWPNSCSVQWQWRISFRAGFQVNDSAF